MKNIIAIALREWRMILKDKRLRSVVLVAPVIYALLMGSVYLKHTVPKVDIAVMNNDQGSIGHTLIRMLDSSSKLSVKDTVYSMDTIKEGMISGNLAAAVVIPREFTKNLKNGQDTNITVFVNAATMVNANSASSAINRVVQTLSSGIEIRGLMKHGLTQKSAQQAFMPIKMDLRPMFNPSFNYTNFMIPGILISILQQVILMGIALSITGEKEFNTLGQLFGISKNPIELMLGKGAVYFIVNFIVLELYLRILFPLWDIPIVGSWYLTLFFSTLFTITVVTWGLWVSALCKTRLFATQALMFLAMPSFVLSGFTWPLEAMPAAIRGISYALPMTHFVSNFRQIYLAGSTFSMILPGIYVLTGFIIVNVIMFYFIVKNLIKVTEARPESI